MTWTSFVAPMRAALFLGHGAGGGIDAADLVRVSEVCGLASIAVALVEQPYRVAGKAIASDRHKLDAAFRAVVEAERPVGVPLFVGGRSAGARIACRTAKGLDARGVVALAFPLHPPKDRDRSRLLELLSAGRPVLVVQGTRDAFGTPSDFPPGARLVAVEGGDHSFKVLESSGRTQAEVLARVSEAVSAFVIAELTRSSGLV